MPKISKQKIEKISEQILFHLYSIFPKQIFTSEIAKELARDEEFIKKLLKTLEKKKLVIKIDKNPKGLQYSRRSRWRISNKAHNIYKKHQ
jgi:predicted transcriptional regulator with HTH domain